MTDSSRYGTHAVTCAGVSNSTGSMPHAFDDAIRRLSSSIRSGVRATSMPPHSVKTPSSWYWRTLSSVNAVISLEWSVRKMKFDACPVEPPGFGSAPLSSRTMSRQPRRAKCQAMLLPTIPAPMMTTFARSGSAPMPLRPPTTTENAASPGGGTSRPPAGYRPVRIVRDAGSGRIVREHRVRGTGARRIGCHLRDPGAHKDVSSATWRRNDRRRPKQRDNSSRSVASRSRSVACRP